MKPKYLMQDALSSAILLVVLSIAVIAVSVHMAFSPNDTADATLVVISALLVLAVGIKTYFDISYCLLDEKGIKFFLRFKQTDFVSWESITKIERRQYGHGRGRAILVLIYSDEFCAEPLSPVDANSENYARAFRVAFGSDAAFAEYLSHYRSDLKMEEN